MRHPRRFALVALATLALLAGACTDASPDQAASASPSASATIAAGSASLDGAEIAVGSKDYDEQLILGNISKLVLEAAGANVTDRLNGGGTDAVRGALTDGQIDHYWEYTGIGWHMHLDNTEKLADPQMQWRRVRAAELANGVAWLMPAPFNNTYGIAFKRNAGDRFGNPETISDLANLVDVETDEATLCVGREFRSRPDGLPGVEQAYGFEFPDDNVTTLDLGVIYSATDSGDPCNFGEVFTTDGRIAALGLQVLEDDAGFFPIYNAAPVFAAETYGQYGQALDALFAPIVAALTQDTMIRLNERVSADGELPEDVARSFLADNDLLAE